jgi:2-dehydro-3-deoxygluconokinase
MSKILCFGELLLRLSPELDGGWIRNNSMPVFIGGAELNAATALALWEIPVAYCTALPDHYLSKEIIDSVAQKNIEPRIHFSGSRIGTYYLPQGADLKAAGVIYDRAHSSFWCLHPADIDWDKMLQGVSWFHFSAISPALNENAAAVCKMALQQASARGIFISVDLNYRAKLWQYGKEPSAIMPALAEHCNLVMGNLWAAEKMLGIELPPGLRDKKEAYLQQAEKTSAAIMKRFPRCSQVANTFRFDRDSGGILYYATLYNREGLFVSKEHSAGKIVDKVGSGDCFMGGLIYGNYRKLPAQDIIDFAAAAAFHKLFIKGDATTATVEQIRKAIPDYA